MPEVRESQTQQRGSEPAVDVDAFKRSVVGTPDGSFLGWTKKRDPFAAAQAADSGEESTPASTDEGASQESEGVPAGNGETEPAPTEEKPGESPEPSSGKAEGESGSPPVSEQDAVDSILKKYGTEAKVVDAYRHLQQKFSAATEEAKELREFINSVFDVEGENLSLRPEVAARVLRQQQDSSPGTIDEKAIRKQVESERRAWAQENAEDPEAYMAAHKGLIEELVKTRVTAAKADLQQRKMKDTYEAAQISERFFKANPKAEELIDEIDSWFGGNSELQILTLRQNPELLKRIYEAESMKRDFKTALQEAFRTGYDAKAKELKISSSSAKPSAAATSPLAGGQASDDFKARVLGSGKRSVLGRLLAR